jgi:hypothetical protein
VRDFWKSAGFHLVRRNDKGWLEPTADLMRAYWTRPEVHPVEESNAHELALHAALLEDPFRAVTDAEITRLEDPDAIETYRIVLGFRDYLVRAGSIEGAYLTYMQRPDATDRPTLPPVFIDQMVHLILRNVMRDVDDPLRVRAAELFFRAQVVSTDGGRIMLADDEIVDLQAKAQKESGLAQLLAETGTPQRDVTLDVLSEENGAIYWARSDRYDTVIDMRFEQPALDAFARVMEMWLAHLLKLEARIEPRPRLDDTDWRWHIGLDADATRILNALFTDKTVPVSEMEQFVSLFRMQLDYNVPVVEGVRGRPIYMGLAKTRANRVVMKPQNLLTNLPLLRQS